MQAENIIRRAAIGSGLIKALKAKNVSPPISSPVCRRAMCGDSAGNRIVLHQMKTKKA